MPPDASGCRIPLDLGSSKGAGLTLCRSPQTKNARHYGARRHNGNRINLVRPSHFRSAELCALRGRRPSRSKRGLCAPALVGDPDPIGMSTVDLPSDARPPLAILEHPNHLK
jgi:hypothetical protein